MKRRQVWFKNFAAGRKNLLKNILFYCGSALAVYEIMTTVLHQQAIIDLISKSAFCLKYVYPVLDSALFYLGLAVVFAILM